VIFLFTVFFKAQYTILKTLYPTLLAEIERFKQLTQAQRYLVAFSGGLDSTVLLHLLTRDNLSLKRTQALYVDHQIQSESAAWALHCQTICKNWMVDLQCVKVTLDTKTRQGVEAKARKARYQALYHALQPNTLLLTAHHQRDQAETFLLNLTRGSGVAGLAAMPYQKTITLESGEQSLHFRPLLKVPYSELVAYATRHKLSWVEDQSNYDNRYARNQVRNQLLPEFEQACPVIQQQIQRAASHQAEALDLLDRLAEQDLKLGEFNQYSIKLVSYQKLDWPSLKNVLRLWAKSCLNVSFNFDQLAWIKRYALDAKSVSASSKLQHGALKLYREKMYYVADIYKEYEFNLVDFTARLKSPSQFESGLRCTMPMPTFELLLPQEWLNKYHAKLTIRNLKESDQVNRNKLKKWFQEQGISTWQRVSWPILCLDNLPFLLCGANLKKGALNPEQFQKHYAQLGCLHEESKTIRYLFAEIDVIEFFQSED